VIKEHRISGTVRLLRSEFIALQTAHDGNNALVDIDEFAVWQGAAIVRTHIFEDDLLAVGFVDRHVSGFLERADGAGGFGTLIQELDNLQVESILEPRGEVSLLFNRIPES
jgi:hypothetical protein